MFRKNKVDRIHGWVVVIERRWPKGGGGGIKIVRKRIMTHVFMCV